MRDLLKFMAIPVERSRRSEQEGFAMAAKDAAAAWAREEFGRAKLGNVSRTRRLVKIATAMAATVHLPREGRSPG